MQPNEYQKDAMRTEQAAANCNALAVNARLLNGVMGLCGEAGEAAELVKKHLFQGHDLNREHLAKELGDVAWYLAVSADAIGYSLEDVLSMNVRKRKARYPDGFDPAKSRVRADGDV